MAFELEALVGHLYIFSGRAIRINPPGALVAVAPDSAARAREGDTFFALVVPSGFVAPTTFYEQMAKLAAERYFNLGGSITIALRAMFQALNRSLYEHNRAGQQQYEASIIAAVLHDEDMYVGRVGPVASVLHTNGLTLTFPEDFSDDEPLFSVPLGVLPEPEMNMVRYAVDSGTRLLLSDANIADIPWEKLDSILMEKDIEKALEQLRRAIVMQGQLMLVELVPPEFESPMLVAAGESSTEVNAKLAEARAQIEEERQQGQSPRQVERGELAKRARAKAARRAAGGLHLLSRLLDRLLPIPDSSSERGFGAGSITLAVLLIPIVIVAVVVVSWVSNLGETDFEQCLSQLEETAGLARSIDSGDRRGVLQAWNATLLVVDGCEDLRPGDPSVQSVRDEAQNIIDLVSNIQRRTATALTAFPNADITRLRLQGLDMYALDTGSSLVYRIKLNDEGSGVVQQEPVPNMRRGATVQGLSIGQIVDIAFDDLSGELALLDERGTLVRCSLQFIMDCNAQRILAVDQWEQPISLTIWGRRLYILDGEGGQIWRYDPSGSNYVSAPREYFAGESRANLRNVVDFTISRLGIVYILYADGVMKSYVGGYEQPFAFSGFNAGSEPSVVTTQGFALNDSPFQPAFFIISRPARTIFETTLAGTFIDSYQVFEQDKLALLSSVVAYPAQNILYVASGNSIFVIQKR